MGDAYRGDDEKPGGAAGDSSVCHGESIGASFCACGARLGDWRRGPSTFPSPSSRGTSVLVVFSIYDRLHVPFSGKGPLSTVAHVSSRACSGRLDCGPDDVTASWRSGSCVEAESPSMLGLESTVAPICISAVGLMLSQ